MASFPKRFIMFGIGDYAKISSAVVKPKVVSVVTKFASPKRAAKHPLKDNAVYTEHRSFLVDGGKPAHDKTVGSSPPAFLQEILINFVEQNFHAVLYQEKSAKSRGA